MMKNLFALLAFFLYTFGFAQKTEIDTAQIVIPNRYNSADAQTKPYLILISADGFRYDYAEKYHAENLLRFSQNGVRAKAMIPGFPSITGPNHYTLVTGLAPAHHGMIDNNFYDYKRKENFNFGDISKISDGSWLGGYPLWGVAERQGMLTASMMWVASNSDAGGTRPTYYYNYHEKFSPAQKVDKVINWLQLPMDRRPHFITLYFPEVDAAGHHFGPNGEQTKNAVQLVDTAVGELVKKVNALGLKNVDFIFVSDHGMLDVDNASPLPIPEMLLDKNRFDYYNSQTLLRVVVKNPAEVKQVFKELKQNKTADYDVVLVKNVKRKLHFAKRDDRFGRIGDILLMPKAPKIFLEKGRTTSEGKHGYDPYITPEMKATFFAWGPDFKNNYQIGEFRNVNVYPLAAHILGLKISAPVDGKFKTLKKTLKSKN